MAEHAILTTFLLLGFFFLRTLDFTTGVSLEKRDSPLLIPRALSKARLFPACFVLAMSTV